MFGLGGGSVFAMNGVRFQAVQIGCWVLGAFYEGVVLRCEGFWGL